MTWGGLLEGGVLRGGVVADWWGNWECVGACVGGLLGGENG